MYRAQVHNQAGSDISSNGKVPECLVSSRGLGRTLTLLENLMLIFDLAVHRVLRRSLRG